MDALLIILSVLILLLMLSSTIFIIYLMRWMKRRDMAMAEMLRRMMERKHELENVRNIY